MANPLLTLMQTLTPPEKRYCHLYLKAFSGKKGSNHLLNDFLRAEELSKVRNEDKKKISFKSNSTRLYYKVLDILYEYHLNSELFLLDEDELNIKRSKILYTKGFFNEADKLITKVIVKANDNNRLRKIEAIELKLEHAINKGDVDYLSEKFNDDKDRLLNYFNEYYNFIEYGSLWAMVKLKALTSYFYKNLPGDNANNYARLLSNEEVALTPRAKTMYYKIKSFMALNNNDMKSSLDFTKKSVAIFEANPQLLKSDLADYLKAIRNLYRGYSFNGEFGKANELLQRTENSGLIPANSSKAVQIESFCLFVMMKLDLAIDSGEIKKVEPELKVMEQKFKEMEELLSADERITTMFYLAVVNICLGYYRKALRCNNYVKQHAGTIRSDLYHIALMNELVIHFQLNNLQLLESKVRAFRRFISESAAAFEFENKIPDYFSSLIAFPEKKSIYRDLQNEVLTSLTKEKKMVYERFMPFIYFKKII